MSKDVIENVHIHILEHALDQCQPTKTEQSDRVTKRSSVNFFEDKNHENEDLENEDVKT